MVDRKFVMLCNVVLRHGESTGRKRLDCYKPGPGRQSQILLPEREYEEFPPGVGVRPKKTPRLNREVLANAPSIFER